MNIEQLRVLIALNRLLITYAALNTYVQIIEARQGAANPLADVDAVMLPALQSPLTQYKDCLHGYFVSRGMDN